MLDIRAEDGLPSYQHQVQQDIGWNESLEAFQQPEETKALIQLSGPAYICLGHLCK